MPKYLNLQLIYVLIAQIPKFPNSQITEYQKFPTTQMQIKCSNS